MLPADKHELLARVATLYYEEELTQNQIADRLGLSRVKVYRLLNEAKATGVVRIIIDKPVRRNTELEEELVHRFGLRQALVAQTAGLTSTQALQQVGQLGARYLEEILKDGDTIAVCLGRSTYEVVKAIRPGCRSGVRVAQAVGSIPFAMPELDSSAVAHQLAQKLGGEVMILPSPYMADSPDAAEVMRAQSDIERTLAAARQADVALVGIGNLDPATSRFLAGGSMSADELAALASAGAVGDIAGRIYTLDGQLHENEYNRRVIGITLAELERIPTTIAAAAGNDKSRAILGALRTGVIDVLCTDDGAARGIIALAA